MSQVSSSWRLTLFASAIDLRSVDSGAENESCQPVILCFTVFFFFDISPNAGLEWARLFVLADSHRYVQCSVVFIKHRRTLSYHGGTVHYSTDWLT